MGIYCYTLRKNVINAIDMDTSNPVAIGVTKYAYKESWNGAPEYKRKVARMHAAAERARQANPHLDLVTFGDPKDHDFDRFVNMPVYKVSTELESFFDGKAPGVEVGFLYKRGRKYEFEKIPA